MVGVIMRSAFKKVLVITLFISCLCLSFVAFKHSGLKNKDTDYDMKNLSFTNDLFNTDMPDATVTETETFVDFDKVYEIIYAAMRDDSYQSATDRDNYIVNQINSLVGDKRVAIHTAEDLYNISTSASYNFNTKANYLNEFHEKTIKKVLDLDYVLLNDIDYSVMKAKMFVPLGTDLTLPDMGTGSEIHLPFTGSFDGHGYTITNLYLADYNYITMHYRTPGDTTGTTELEIPLSNYYAMFANVGSSAVIGNLQIKDPILELLDVPDGLYKTAVLAGENNGTIFNCSVVDERKTASGEEGSGIMWTLPQGVTQEKRFEAAGLVHTNNGKLYNSYYSSNRVVYDSSKTRFITKPVIFDEGQGSVTTGVGYNEVVDENVNNLNSESIKKYSYSNIRSGKDSLGNDICINDFDLSTINTDVDVYAKWHFFEMDTLPTLEGLNYSNELDAFLIHDERDLQIFSKLLSRISKYNNINYSSHNYVITRSLDMSYFKGYTPPKEEFKGTLSGGNYKLSSNGTNDNIVIKNLIITHPYSTSTEIYYGLLSKCSGTVSGINFQTCEIDFLKDEISATKTVYAGIVCGYLYGGTIKDILTSSDIHVDTDTGPIGASYIGGLVGYGNGTISYVANTGNIDGGENHDFTGLSVNSTYQIGGILGGSTGKGLTLNNAINTGNVTGIGATSTFTPSLGKTEMSVGGIIGKLQNDSNTDNSVYYVTNKGNIKSNVFNGSNNNPTHIYVSGIIGNVTGKSGDLNKGETVLNGRYENYGSILGSYSNEYTYTYNAGILVASTNEYSEFSYMVNKSTVNTNLTNDLGMNSSNNNKNIYYAATVVDNSSAGITVSRAYNEENYTFTNDYFKTGEALIAPFFASVNNNRSKLFYCHNNGDILVQGTSDITTTGDVRVAGITQSHNVDYENVYMSGDIKLININQTADLYVAGIAWILPFSNNTANYAKNCINEGKIVTSGIKGNTSVINNQIEYEVSNWWGGTTTETGYGTDQTAPVFSATIDANNLYVAGLFNLNVGEITNSMNRADITSEEESYEQISGTCNTFVGGLVTYNYNLIQDCANTGDINYTNTSSGTTYVAGGDDPNCHFGGLVFAYNGGLALGGICSALADRQATILNDTSKGINYGRLEATTTNSMAKIYDSSNNGNVYGKARQYVRSGGVLAVALGVELTAGTDTTSSTSATKKFSYHEVGAGDRVATSELSNGLNFGNITAITNKIGEYKGTNGTSLDNSHSYNNAKRPGIYSCSGGVIAYGLCKMMRMINHGVVSSCDVAGGVVGATYVLGTQNTNNGYSVTTVDINTAVHYGKVKAIKNASYNSCNYSTISSQIDNSQFNTTYFYPDGDTSFIFPISGNLTFDNLSLYPNKKRGFGGIFGRLQRGNSGVMNSNNFINILNMDPNVDMIGRADGSSYAAYYYYKLFVRGREDTYYSARTNDTTPALIVGYNSATIEGMNIISATSIVFTITRTGNGNNRTYYVTGVQLNNGSGEYVENISRSVSYYLENASNNPNQTTTIEKERITGTFNNYNYSKTYNNNTRININDYGFTTSQLNEIRNNWNGNTKTYTINNPSNFFMPDSSTDIVTSYRMEIVTDDPNETDYTYIFNEEFPLMDKAQSNYIYKANNDVLADRFRLNTSTNYKPNGMYVLATTKGRDAGDVLPANLDISSFYRINEEDVKYVDLENLDFEDLITDEGQYTDLINEYKSMFQIRLSDKSLIMPREDDPLLYDIVLVDKNGNGPELGDGVIGEVNGVPTITFTAPEAAFNAYNVNYIAQSATLSENAVIAKSGINHINFNEFNSWYNIKTSNIATGSLESSVSGTVVPGNAVTLTGNITVYSEIAAQVGSLVETYKTDYQIIVNVVPTPLEMTLTSAMMDGINITVPNLTNNTIYNFGNTNSIKQDGELFLVFTDTNDVLEHDHKITFIGLYYEDETEPIDSEFYETTFGGKDDTNNQLTFAITLHEELQSGNYRFVYKYYSHKDESYTVIFNKRASSDNDVWNVNYDGYSFSDDVDDLEFIHTSGNFDTYTGFGNYITGIKGSNLVFTQQMIEKNPEHQYLDNIGYYELMINGVKVLDLELAPFASLISWSSRYQYTATGDLEQIFEYVVKAEDETTETIVHTIKERTLPEMVIYKDGVLQLSNLITIPRDNSLTQINVDFRFDNTDYYSNINPNLSLVTAGNTIQEVTEDMVYFENTEYYYIVNVTGALEPSTVEIAFILTRDTDVTKNIGTIIIEKELGYNAYLQDINFQVVGDSVSAYPSFYEADENGNVVDNSDYEIRGYYAGIDYDNADINGIKHFRIDGTVADVDLESYSPNFTIPLGSTIERLDEDGNWTTDLEANYLGEEEDSSGELKDVVVTYRIISEDLVNTVYYHVTARDVLYNLTLRFTIYYQLPNGECIDASDANSPINNRVVLIIVRNYALKETDENGQTIEYAKGDDGSYPYVATEDNKGGITDYITGMNNQSTLFYAPCDLTKYTYTFGRNLSGCYGFSIVTPIYEGETTGELINGERYNYEIYLKQEDDWYQESNLLPNLDLNGKYDGKYFFIENSHRNRIRNFAIVITPKTVDESWGLTDNDTTWN